MAGLVSALGWAALLCLVALALIPLGDLRRRVQEATRAPSGVHFPGGTQALTFDLAAVLALTLLAAAIAAGLAALSGRRARRVVGLTIAAGALAALGYAFLGG